ncbi:MAG: hypothetical protein PHI66_04420 [Candidatus Pacebacteria bacterium]|nr:hypothetical protein [Candidatus Paceibacterota bacterium]
MTKFSKSFIYLLLFVSLLSGLVYICIPDLYASYITGYSVDSIVGYRMGDFDQSLLCKEFFPENVSIAINNLFMFSVLTFMSSFILIIGSKLVLRKTNGKEVLLQPRGTLSLVIFLFLDFLVLFICFISEPDYSYLVGCEQFKANCQSILENPENAGAKNIEELYTRGEYLYCN